MGESQANQCGVLALPSSSGIRAAQRGNSRWRNLACDTPPSTNQIAHLQHAFVVALLPQRFAVLRLYLLLQPHPATTAPAKTASVGNQQWQGPPSHVN